MPNRFTRIVVIGFFAVAVVFSLAFGTFWYNNKSTIEFIQNHRVLFAPYSEKTGQIQLFDTFLQKINDNPKILETLRKNQKELQNGMIIVGRNNEELGYYEDEVQFPIQCPEDEKACASVRTALTAARENSVLSYQLAFQFWVKESNNKSFPIDFYDLVYDYCLVSDGGNGFRGCQMLSESIIEETTQDQSGDDLSNRIQLYAIERSVANYRYEYDFFEATANRFFNDRALRSLIQDDFESIAAFLWLPESLRSEFEIDTEMYSKAKDFADTYPQVVAYLIQQN
jgi:hypothetical protein